MNKEKFIEKTKETLSKLKKHVRFDFLFVLKNKIDNEIFNPDNLFGNEYRCAIIEMLSKKDIAEKRLSLLFEDYKNKWPDEKRRYFDSNEEINYLDFLKAFEVFLPQDIVESIKKCKSVSLEKLKLTESINIFQNYYDIREWLKSMIAAELENQKLTDNELLLLANHEEIKFKWLGSAVELVGLFDNLESKKWIVPVGSSREKATYLLKCFSFSDKERSVGYIEKIYKTSTSKAEPFDKIITRK